MSKVRIINEKTGDVKFVSPMVAKDTRQLKAYGYVVQDLGEKKDLGLIYTPPIEPEEVNDANDLIANESNEPTEDLHFENIADEQPAKVKGKPGPKKKETVTE